MGKNAIGSKKIMNKKVIYVLLILLTVITALTTSGLILFNSIKDNSIVMTVNEKSVNLREFKMILNEQRAATFSYFNVKYGAEDSKDFWTSSFGGEIPIEVAKKKTSDYIIEVKVQQQLGVQKNIINDSSYSAFLEELKKENKKRKEAVKNNQVIYGPEKYGEREYYFYLFYNILIKLKEKMSEKEIAVNESELKEIYEKYKESDFKNKDTVRVQRIYILYHGDNNISKSDAELKINEIKERLEKGESLEGIKSTMKDVNVQNEESVFDQGVYEKDGAILPEVNEEIERLTKVGQISNPITDSNSYSILKLLERVPGGFKDFNDVKEEIKSKLIDSKYDELIKKKVNNAKVKVNKKIYKEINSF